MWLRDSHLDLIFLNVKVFGFRSDSALFTFIVAQMDNVSFMMEEFVPII